MAKITQTDMKSLIVGYPKSIEDRDILPHIDDCFEVDFNNILPSDLLAAIEALDLAAEPQPKPELVVFYNKFFRKPWAYFAYARMLAVHGKRITAFGVKYHEEINSSNVEAEERAYMRKQFLNDGNVFLTKAKNRLAEVKYIFDNTNYEGNKDVPLKKKRTYRISGV